MKVEELLNHGFSEISLPEPDREIKGVYIGDLLSWVMGRATSGDAWVTIMSNINVIAVAQLTDVACVILAEGVVARDQPFEKVAESPGDRCQRTGDPNRLIHKKSLLCRLLWGKGAEMQKEDCI